MKIGNKTPLFRMTAKAELALTIDTKTIDDLLMELDEEAAAAALIRILSNRQP